jgi:hypothetical protein
MFPAVPLGLSFPQLKDKYLLMNFSRDTGYGTYLGNLNRLCLENGLVDAFSFGPGPFDSHYIFQSTGIFGFHVINSSRLVAKVISEPETAVDELGQISWLRRLTLISGKMVIELHDRRAKDKIYRVASGLSDNLNLVVGISNIMESESEIVYADFNGSNKNP